MVYDCFSFFNELDLLEVRLNVLSDVVDRFVLVESTITHTGKAKPLFYELHKQRFAAFAPRIVHVVVSEFPPAPKGFSQRQRAWLVENVQRNAVMRGLCEAKPEDVVMISDLDEIPNPDVVRLGPPADGIFVLRQKLFSYFLNYRNYTVPFWYGTRMMRFASFTDSRYYAGYKSCEYVIDFVNEGPTPTKNRFLPLAHVIKDGGWHYSYLGGIHAIENKVKSIAHTEFSVGKTEDYVRMCIETGTDVSGYGYRYFADPIEVSAPEYIVANQGVLKKFIYPVTKDYLRRTAFSRWRVRMISRIRACLRHALPAVVRDRLYNLIVLRK